MIVKRFMEITSIIFEWTKVAGKIRKHLAILYGEVQDRGSRSLL